MTPTPEHVFTPAGTLEDGMFASRSHDALEERIMAALTEQGRHPVVHGWTGVGKTSLVHHVCETNGIDYLAVDCSGSFAELMQHALHELGLRLDTGRVVGNKMAVEGGSTFFGLLTAKAAGETSREAHSTPYAIPLERLVVEALVNVNKKVLFIDSLEDLSSAPSEQRGILRLIKLCSERTRDLRADAPHLILAGPTPITRALLAADRAAARRTMAIEVPRMQRDEVEQILVRGQTKLKISFSQDCRDRIVELADGFPYYAHLYALHSSRRAIRHDRAAVEVEDFDWALAEIIDSCSPPLAEAYSLAIRGRGEPSLRRGVLAALASAPSMEVTITDVQAAFLELHPAYERPERVRFVGRLLRELRDVHGIVEDAWLESGEAGFRFSDPLMRVYVNLIALRDQQRAREEWEQSLPD